MPESNKEPLHGVINVPLALFWADPGKENIFKEISRQAALNPAAWAENLSIAERLWLVGKVETTALYGETVVILEKQDDWIRVAAVAQPTCQNKLGYPGWVLANQVYVCSAEFNSRHDLDHAVVAVPKATLFADSGLTVSCGLLSYQTRLPIVSETGLSFHVALPDGTTGYLARNEIKTDNQLFFNSQAILREARQFLGLPYLWGGTSSDGFDCSGFMFRLYQSQGISIPRNASEQAKAGIAVAKENLCPGDLLFFARDNCAEKIHHVGMFIGEGLMIHSPNSQSVVRIEPFETGIYGEEYWGARRFSGSQQSVAKSWECF